ncbi:MAG: hypothetical protein HDR94_08110 [Bacteroides sp.]|nr:hypothetical protein [Bacteroides sp.]
MEIKTVKLGEIAEFANGLNYDKSAYRAGVKIIGVSDFKDYSIPIIDSLAEVAIDAVKESARLKENDIIFVRSNGNKDLVGRCMIIPHTSEKLYFSGFCIRCRFKNTIYANPRYFLYLFKSPSFRRQLSNTSVGANIQNLSQSRLAMASVPLPTKEVQDKIASILSAYDEMIDNCRAQIVLLEEAAQRLYREWFVDLRFPGYETTPICENGLPAGWTIESIGMVCDIKTGRKDANFGGKVGEYPFFTCAQEPIRANSYSFDTQAIILAGNGDFNVKIFRGKFEAYQRTYVITTESDLIWLSYFAIKRNMSKLSAGASGSTIKFLTKGMIEDILFYRPLDSQLSTFNKIVSCYFNQLETIKEKLSEVLALRDLLLPRLISGQIEINA